MLGLTFAFGISVSSSNIRLLYLCKSFVARNVYMDYSQGYMQLVLDLFFMFVIFNEWYILLTLHLQINFIFEVIIDIRLIPFILCLIFIRYNLISSQRPISKTRWVFYPFNACNEIFRVNSTFFGNFIRIYLCWIVWCNKTHCVKLYMLFQTSLWRKIFLEKSFFLNFEEKFEVLWSSNTCF